VRIHDCVLTNAGWEVEKVDKEDSAIENKFALRGYKLVKKETRELVFDKPGDYDITCWRVC
jgi:singapore isolate B (sub-type 7) whole genome shotgun sequence assembly, scaffold_7